MKNLHSALFFIVLAVGSRFPAFAETPATASELSEPMLGNYDSVWGSAGVHYRLRPEMRLNGDLNSDADDKNIFALQRARLNLALNYRDWLESFVQFQDARYAGMFNSTTAYTGNTDLHQAWVKFTMFDKRLNLKIGRQQLVYGDQRLIGNFEWSNQGRVFEAAQLRYNSSLGWLDLFGSLFTPDPMGNFANATFFSGAYNHFAFLKAKLEWEQYFLILKDSGDALPPGSVIDPLNPPTVTLDREVFTAGTRLRFFDSGLSTGVEGAYQFGSSNKEKDIKQNAFALHGDAKYTFDVSLSPYLKVESNFATGNDDDAKATERFVNLFPTNHLHYGYMDLQSWANAFNLSGGIGLRFSDYFALMVDYWMLSRSSENDGWLDAGGVELASATDASAKFGDEKLLGHEIDTTLKITVNKHLDIMTGASFFAPSGFARTKGEDAQVWGYTMLSVTL
ncbi:MAG: hypothetical protein Kow0090_18580 [Myxococcota bacterium]